jgi:hypothetical protein
MQFGKIADMCLNGGKFEVFQNLTLNEKYFSAQPYPAPSICTAHWNANQMRLACERNLLFLRSLQIA